MDLPSVNLNELRERGIVVRCTNFSVDALRSDENKKAKRKTSLPVVASDKKTFNIPDDVYNPASRYPSYSTITQTNVEASVS